MDENELEEMQFLANTKRKRRVVPTAHSGRMDVVPAPPEPLKEHTLYSMETDVRSSMQNLPLRDNWRPYKLGDSVYYLAITELMDNVQMNKERNENIVHSYSQSRSDEKKAIFKHFSNRNMDYLFFQTGT